MELYQEMLVNLLKKGNISVTVEGLPGNVPAVLESEAYHALHRIKEILEDDSLTDAECFEKIERIVCVFEELGSDGGNRHDFG